MKYAIYARTAVKDNKKMLEQEKTIRQTLKKGDVVCGVYRDNGCSGATLNRPAMSRLRSDARRGIFGGVLVAEPSRLGRNTKDWLNLVDELISNGLVIKTLTGEISGASASGRLMFNMLKGFSDFDREARSERIKKGLRAAALKKK